MGCWKNCGNWYGRPTWLKLIFYYFLLPLCRYNWMNEWHWRLIGSKRKIIYMESRIPSMGNEVADSKRLLVLNANNFLYRFQGMFDCIPNWMTMYWYKNLNGKIAKVNLVWSGLDVRTHKLSKCEEWGATTIAFKKKN